MTTSQPRMTEPGILTPAAIRPQPRPARYGPSWSVAFFCADLTVIALSAMVAQALTHLSLLALVANDEAAQAAMFATTLWLLLFERIGMYRRTFSSHARDEVYASLAGLRHVHDADVAHLSRPPGAASVSADARRSARTQCARRLHDALLGAHFAFASLASDGPTHRRRRRARSRGGHSGRPLAHRGRRSFPIRGRSTSTKNSRRSWPAATSWRSSGCAARSNATVTNSS